MEIKIINYSNIAVLKIIVEECLAGVTVLEMCTRGDQLLIEKTDQVYRTQKSIKKGS